MEGKNRPTFKKLCEKENIAVCDCYAKWKKLYDGGVDITELLANKINHPTREMNWLFAYSLVETMLTEDTYCSVAGNELVQIINKKEY